MSENNSEKIEISYRSLGLDEARKQSPLLFLVENDEDNKKKTIFTREFPAVSYSRRQEAR